MKIILSRKGFDSTNGEIPSPILPDGTLLSLPIPDLKETETKFSQLSYGDKSYDKIIRELKECKSKTESRCFEHCHLDPAIKNIQPNRITNWIPAFGQSGAAQGHLRNHCVDVGDIFLFFGWFKETTLNLDGKYCYIKGDFQDKHIIFGYLQIGKIYDKSNCDDLPSELRYHPHANYLSQENNCIYAATENLSFNDNRKGADVFKYSYNLVLTKEGMSRSKWDLPEFFKDTPISYHTDKSFNQDGYFQSAHKGQEFVITDNEKVIKWAKKLIEEN